MVTVLDPDQAYFGQNYLFLLMLLLFSVINLRTDLGVPLGLKRIW